MTDHSGLVVRVPALLQGGCVFEILSDPGLMTPPPPQKKVATAYSLMTCI